MANAKQCDICLQFYLPEEVDMKLILYTDIHRANGIKDEVDLCYDCIKSFYDWMENPK